MSNDKSLAPATTAPSIIIPTLMKQISIAYLKRNNVRSFKFIVMILSYLFTVVTKDINQYFSLLEYKNNQSRLMVTLTPIYISKLTCHIMLRDIENCSYGIGELIKNDKNQKAYQRLNNKP